MKKCIIINLYKGEIIMRKALLIVDMSNDFVADKGSLTVGKKAQEIVNRICIEANEYLINQDLVIFCNDFHKKNDSHFLLWPSHCVENTFGSQLFGDLLMWYQQNQTNPNVFLLHKSEYDAFYKTHLNQILTSFSVKEANVCGVCTDICVFNTVYGAYKEGLKTVVDENLVATFTNNQEVFLDQMNAIYQTKIIKKK